MINIEAIATSLEAQTCPEHGQHPKITVQPEGLSIAACCQPFHNDIAARLEQEIETGMSKIMEEAMKHLEG